MCYLSINFRFSNRSTEDTTSKKTVPSMKAFIDVVTMISESKLHMEELLKCLQEPFKWAVMKLKPSKSRNLSIIKERFKEIESAIDDNVVPTIREKSVKSLGHSYSLSLTDRHRWQDLLKQLKDEFLSIYKLWSVYFGLIPRLAWPMQIYEVSLSRIEKNGAFNQ